VRATATTPTSIGRLLVEQVLVVPAEPAAGRGLLPGARLASSPTRIVVAVDRSSTELRSEGWSNSFPGGILARLDNSVFAGDA
jgi:hypothetical protein